MSKLIIPPILAATVLIAGMFALMPVEKASTVHTAILAGIRDDTTITDAQVAANQRLVLLDNLGIGGKADVEVTWRFSDSPDCKVEVIGGTISTGGDGGASPIAVPPAAPAGTLARILANDGAFGGNPPHADVQDTEVVSLIGNAAICDLNHALGDFVTVSVVGV